MARLDVFEFRLHIDGPEGRSVVALAQGAAILGRNPGSEITLIDKQVSRRHARIDCGAVECLLTDLGSGNGTFIDGRRLLPDAPEPLVDGSRFQIGPYDLRLEQVLIEIPAEPLPEPALEEPAAAPGNDQPAPPAGPPVAPRQAPPDLLPEVEAGDAASFGVNGTGAARAEILPGFAPDGRFLLAYLPGIYHTEFMGNFLAIFESVLLPTMWTIDNFDLFLSPATAPHGFLPWLGGWWNLTFSPGWSESQRRALLQEAHRIYERRGTRWALSRVLEIFTGSPPEIDDTGRDLKPFVFRVKIAPLPQDGPDRSQIEALIEAHKPAHTSYILEILPAGD